PAHQRLLVQPALCAADRDPAGGCRDPRGQAPAAADHRPDPEPGGAAGTGAVAVADPALRVPAGRGAARPGSARISARPAGRERAALALPRARRRYVSAAASAPALR